MKRSIKTAGVAIFASAALVASLGLAACGGSSSNSSTAESTAESTEASTEAAAAPGEDAGFTEIPIFEDETAGFMNVSAVYFQPVPMTDGNSIEDYDLLLEADIAANENDYGYEAGSWVPYLTVDYDVIGSDGKSAASGTFMEMSASDGPHYGANIALPKADTYKLVITIHSPADNNYLLHTDAETGPGAQSFDETFGDGPLKVEFEGWDYTPQEW